MRNTKDKNNDVAICTPKRVAESNSIFSIPIYQRLFEWNRDTIYTLLDGILISMLKNDKEDYYVGMLTSTKAENNLLKLVDGQQRFTVMTLMAITFMYSNLEPNKWRQFLLLKGKPRLDFESRDSDVVFLEKITGDERFYKEVMEYASSNIKETPKNLSCINKKMVAGLDNIKTYLNSIKEQLIRLEYEKRYSNDILNKMSKYVYEHLKFFITQLPEYEAKDLNLYFERMNSAGKNLESHEILKVKMLDKIHKEHPYDYKYFVKAWDVVADMDTRVFIRRSGKRKENAKSFRNRCLATLKIIRCQEPIKCIFKNGEEDYVVNAALKKDDNNEDVENGNVGTGKSIKSIIRKELEVKAPSDDDHRDVPFISLLTFPRFLLQVLYYYSKFNLTKEDCRKHNIKNVNNEEEFKVNEFFNESDLLSTFDHYLSEDNYLDFVNTLFALRVLYDFYVIRIKNNDDSYTLLMSRGLNGDSDNEDDNDDDSKTEFAKLREFESMLYVNSVNVTYYRWLPELLHYVYKPDCNGENGDLVAPNELLNHLKTVDNLVHRTDLEEKNDDNNLDTLSYKYIDRYWFWRLDYYLWEGVVDNKITNLDNKIVKNFRFRRNRSIEHLHPRNESNNETWDNKSKINSFFNLAMISQGFNSTQSNDSVRVKFARIADTINDLESLKMYDMYISANKKDDQWTPDIAQKHGERMMDILINSFPDITEYEVIRHKLEEIKKNNTKLMQQYEN